VLDGALMVDLSLPSTVVPSVPKDVSVPDNVSVPEIVLAFDDIASSEVIMIIGSRDVLQGDEWMDDDLSSVTDDSSLPSDSVLSITLSLYSSYSGQL
jgi:hypothetical protein